MTLALAVAADAQAVQAMESLRSVAADVGHKAVDARREMVTAEIDHPAGMTTTDAGPLGTVMSAAGRLATAASTKIGLVVMMKTAARKEVGRDPRCLRESRQGMPRCS